MKPAAALALSLLPAFVLAGEAPPPPGETSPARPAPGWTRQANSLLLYGADGSLTVEIPLPEPDNSGTVTRETLGGASPDARMAWTLERKLVWTPGRTKLLESRRALKTYGTSGAEMWRDEAADPPERGEPVQFSADGRTLLLSRRTAAGWTVEARTWLGQTVASLGPFPRLISMALTPNGRYVLARWAVPDQSDTHTFVDLATQKRRDIPSAELVLGQARIGDDGAVRSGSKTVYSFEVPASTSSAVEVSTPSAPAGAAK